MNLRRILPVLVWSVALALAVPVVSTATGVGESVAEAGRSKKPRGSTKVCTTKKVGKKSKRVCRRVALFTGHNAPRSELRTEPLERPSGAISIVNDNLRESLTVNIYRPDGSYDDGALAQLDEVFRCKRSGETRAVDPRLYEMLSRISDYFGGKQVELVSGFRFHERSSSRHFHASAMDIRIKGVGLKELHAYAASLDGGGMGLGIYPNSGFIHFDYRAPGEPSYRWTDYSGGSSGKHKAKHKQKSRIAKAKRPTS